MMDESDELYQEVRRMIDNDRQQTRQQFLATLSPQGVNIKHQVYISAYVSICCDAEIDVPEDVYKQGEETVQEWIEQNVGAEHISHMNEVDLAFEDFCGKRMEVTCNDIFSPKPFRKPTPKPVIRNAVEWE